MANFTALKTAINNAIKTNGNEEITGAVLQVILDAMVETLGESAITNLENALSDEITNRQNAVSGVADDLAAEALARAAKDNQLDGRINQEEYNRANADAALSQTMSQGFQTLGSQMNALNAAISALNAAYQNGYLYGGIATPSSSPSNNKCFYIALQGGSYTNFGGVGVVEGINIIKNDSGWKVEHIYDQTTLLNEFYLLRQQVIQAITSFAPIVIEGDVTNAPDEEDLTSNANHLLQFKNNAYSPLEFSGLGRKYLRKNIAPLSESAPFNGFVEGVTAEETLSGTPTQIFWDRMNTRFVGIKDGVYYLDWTDSDNYVPASTSLVYMYNGTPYQWNGSDFIVDETEVPNLVNCLTQDMINEANTIYIIRYDYTLKENITIPANCVLQFDGGSISASGSNDTITGTNTGISAGLVKIFNTDVTLAGTWNVIEVYPEWFGAKGDGLTDDIIALQKAEDVCWDIKAILQLNSCTYIISKPLIVWCTYRHNYNETKRANSHIRGMGNGYTTISKSTNNPFDLNLTYTLPDGRSDCGIALIDYRAKDDPSYSVTFESTCFHALLEDFSIRTTQGDKSNALGILFLSAAYCEFRNISISGYKEGFYCQKYNYGNKFTRVEVQIAEKGFSFGAFNIGGSGPQTTLYFEGCHTGGIDVADYDIAGAATLITCAKDGGTGYFVKTQWSQKEYCFRPRITMIDCHEETPECPVLFTAYGCVLNIKGGLLATPKGCTIFDVRYDGIVNIEGVTFADLDYNNNVIGTCTLYQTRELGSIYFGDNNRINTTLFHTQQILRNKNTVIFDAAGINNIVGYAEAGNSGTFIHNETNGYLNLKVTSGVEKLVYINLGKFNLNEYNAIRYYMQTNADLENYTGIELLYAESVDGNGKPVNSTTFSSSYNNYWEEKSISSNIYSNITKKSYIGNKLPDVGEKYLFIRTYNASGSNLDINIYKIELI